MIGFINTYFFTISLNHNLQPNPSSFSAEDSLHSRSGSASHLILFFYHLYRLEADPQKTYTLPSNANHIEKISSSLVVFTARCKATEVIRLLPVYWLQLECVYRVVVQQRIYVCQYFKDHCGQRNWECPSCGCDNICQHHTLILRTASPHLA
jgi:hypothetical protein